MSERRISEPSTVGLHLGPSIKRSCNTTWKGQPVSFRFGRCWDVGGPVRVGKSRSFWEFACVLYVCWIYPPTHPGCNRGKWRFRLGFPLKTVLRNYPGNGECYCVGGPGGISVLIHCKNDFKNGQIFKTWMWSDNKKLIYLNLDIHFTSWWLNQPLWKIWVKMVIFFPQIGVKIRNIWNHHIAIVVGWPTHPFEKYSKTCSSTWESFPQRSA